MRQLAWLGATPEKSKHSRLEQAQGIHLGQRDEDGELIKSPTDIHLPDYPSAFGYLLGFFYLSGQATQTGMGLAPLTWQELKAFREENELDITLWERELLKKMSEAYCAEYSRASDPKRPAPYVPEDNSEEVDKIALAMKMREQMQLLKRNKNES